MNVLFLDFDGPLFPDRIILHHPDNFKKYPGNINNRHLDYWKMDEVAVSMLNKLYNFQPFYAVISSTWRTLFSVDEIRDLFQVNGLNLPLLDNDYWRTTEFKDSYVCTRLIEIENWVTRYQPNNYLILDDNTSGHSLQFLDNSFIDVKNTILVNYDLGISTYDFKQMWNILKSW
jgi:hypothetical protein